jgi:hypothetical protein
MIFVVVDLFCGGLGTERGFFAFVPNRLSLF